MLSSLRLKLSIMKKNFEKNFERKYFLKKIKSLLYYSKMHSKILLLKNSSDLSAILRLPELCKS